MAAFMSYCPLFWGSREIYNERKTRYMFERFDKKHAVFAFYGCLHELLPTVLWFQGDLQHHKTRYMFESYDQKLIAFVFYGRFYELFPIVYWFKGI